MSNIKFCRFTSNCGPQSKCKGNLFGVMRGGNHVNGSDTGEQ